MKHFFYYSKLTSTHSKQAWNGKNVPIKEFTFFLLVLSTKGSNFLLHEFLTIIVTLFLLLFVSGSLCTKLQIIDAKLLFHFAKT